MRKIVLYTLTLMFLASCSKEMIVSDGENNKHLKITSAIKMYVDDNGDNYVIFKTKKGSYLPIKVQDDNFKYSF